MLERGTAFSTDNRQGLIATSTPPSSVSYDSGAIVGEPPSENETVLFDRAPGSNIATSVRIASANVSDLVSRLRGSFDDAIGADGMSDDTRAEVVRMAADRALRIERPIAPSTDLPQEVRQARIALAMAAMALLAAEAHVLGADELTARDLRQILRRQRPTLPH